ncbi:hypothetical protein M407DRAFT_127233 [Tulasnella calospora MUT 4182]|uniref:Uncharacterized protein n=1 Tax=Tulasnella calospora MUT 4182 TaxID=1051891 RepID=A0A0C3LJR9_9AGAM|nr:hypothetical protein M407DRAFT_127233 [Tulasnella calospora MUT 4182]
MVIARLLHSVALPRRTVTRDANLSETPQSDSRGNQAVNARMSDNVHAITGDFPICTGTSTVKGKQLQIQLRTTGENQKAEQKLESEKNIAQPS